MARQSTTPVQFDLSTRRDDDVAMTSIRAGGVFPLGFVPLLRGDSASGKIAIDGQLGPMPRPLYNAVMARVQAWFVPKPAHPQFAGEDEFMHSYQGTLIKALGQADRTPPPFFTVVNGANLTTAAASKFFKTLGIHIPAGASINSDLIDAFVLIYNFRLAAHSSRLARRKYAAEDITEATSIPRAFWPSGRLKDVVPDYEAALVLGSLDLDVLAGRIPVAHLRLGPSNAASSGFPLNTDGSVGAASTVPWRTLYVNDTSDATRQVYADMVGQTIGTTLADIDKARLTQSFAKLRAAYAGNDATGFDNDDTIVATLLQGLNVPEEQFNRPWLLDSQVVSVGFAERHASDAANLDDSITEGRFSTMLSVNVPRNDAGGLILYTVELMPERLDERQSDEWLLATTVSDLPDALRDIQRPEPVDVVLNRRVDAKHATPGGIYGYEPMNNKWNRTRTRLGGAFYQATPGAAWTEARAAIWQTDRVNPSYNVDHFLAPDPFPHSVFSDTLADCCEINARHSISIVGLTQIGDVLEEANDNYTKTLAASA